MILLILLFISLIVWLGAGLFAVRLQWYDLVVTTVLNLNGIEYSLPVPGMGLLLLLIGGVILIGLVMMIVQSTAKSAITRLHQKDFDYALPIQQYRQLWVDAMNEHTEAAAAWLAPMLAMIVVVGFLLKYLVGLVIILIAKVLPLLTFLFEWFGWTAAVVDQLNVFAIWLLSYAVDANGMLTFGFGVIVLVGLYLYQFERIFIRDYAVMQHQK
jgi:hypothetical protein